MRAFEFIIIGPPLSLQTKNRERLQAWKKTVRDCARKKWRKRGRRKATKQSIAIEIINFYEGSAPDTDNIVKPIQDALNGLIYTDDTQVIDVNARKRNIDGAFKVRNMSSVLGQGFARGAEFVYVKVSDNPDPTRID